MDNWAAIAVAVISLLGSIWTFSSTRKKTTAETESVHVKTSAEVLNMVKAQMESQAVEIKELKESSQVQAGEIKTLQAEIKKLKSRLRCMTERLKEYWQELIERGGNPAPLPDWVDEYSNPDYDED